MTSIAVTCCEMNKLTPLGATIVDVDTADVAADGDDGANDGW